MTQATYKNLILFTILAIISFIPNDLFAQKSTDNNIHFSGYDLVVTGSVNNIAAIKKQNKDYSQNHLPDAVLGNNSSGTSNRFDNNPNFNNDSKAKIKVSKTSDSGVKYGAILELQSDINSTAKNQSLNADKRYIFAESESGKWEFGNNVAANQKMKVGPESFVRAAGGIRGKYLEYVNLPMLRNGSDATITKIGNCNGYVVDAAGKISNDSNCSNVKLPHFILIPGSPISHGGSAKGFYNKTDNNDYAGNGGNSNYGFNKNRTSSELRDGNFGNLENAAKINYYTPRIEGFQAGLSLTPSTAYSGTSSPIYGNERNDVKNMLSLGSNYSENIDAVGLAISAVGEFGQYQKTGNATYDRNNLKAYELGFMATYFGFAVGASYGSWGNSLQPKSGIYSCQYDSNLQIADQNCDSGAALTSSTNNGASKNVKKFSDSNYWTSGIAYEIGPIATSITYLNSNFQNNKYDATSFGVDYKITKGLMPYIEYTKFNFRSDQAKYFDGTRVVNQASLSGSQRQIKNNSGYVILAGLLFNF